MQNKRKNWFTITSMHPCGNNMAQWCESNKI